MKKFFIMLNDFLHAREMVERTEQRHKRTQSELRYCQDLLLDQSGHPEDMTFERYGNLSGEINAYVFHIRQLRSEEKMASKQRFNDLLKNA